MGDKGYDIFDKDAQKFGGYKYTQKENYSAKLATKRQFDGLILIYKKYFKKGLRILDIGCGDGTHTCKYQKTFLAKKVLGFDGAKKAISLAKRKAVDGRTKFKTVDIYLIDSKIKKGQFDLGIAWGVLHHLDKPQIGIKKLSKILDQILVLEPNGYNLVLKIIEKFSAYHKEHNEKSYYPPALNDWFKYYGFEVIDQRYFGVVPYFCPDWMAKILKIAGPVVEKIPVLREAFCGTNLILYSKTKVA